jgi:hypothetical protein
VNLLIPCDKPKSLAETMASWSLWGSLLVPIHVMKQIQPVKKITVMLHKTKESKMQNSEQKLMLG